ncbi:PREDICTED: clathrin coat assembly protein AP180-like [Populus euphratica]|uniref:Clathrin coat assembly protein AP180-like n=1 Tax=Populus euphratica TaxID=75702 RepID=A0AAJ6VHG9_POPEU|nr:PREDICTED: clathrin coat assembly protein AP180-like [Populus euphratica]
MPSKLRKAIGAVKDKTSISLAKVSNANNASNLEVVILKATRHDDVPIDERYVNEVLNLISANKIYAASSAQAIAKRIGKTRNWIVALKSLMLVLRIFQDGDPYFPKEVLTAMKRGAKVLNISNFRDDSKSKPWDYTAFVRTFALYLDERLGCFLTGKLQRRFTNRERENSHARSRRANDSVSEMKPAMLLDKLSYWQKLLDRAVATRPAGAAKTNRLVQVSLYAIVQESFDLYRDISDGLSLLLDSFFQLQPHYCVTAFQTCVKASKQFEELCSFYDLCKSLAVGRTSEYPCVQKISEDLIETLQEFLRDQSSIPTNGRSPVHLLLPAPSNDDASPSIDSYGRCDESSEPNERFSKRGSEFGSQCTSLEDLMSVTDMGSSPPMTSMDRYLELFEKRSHSEDILCTADSNSIHSFTIDQGTLSGANSILDLVSLDGWPPEDQQQEQEQTQRTSASTLDSSTDQSDDHQYNPFLQDTTEIPAIVAPTDSQAVCPVNDMLSMAPTFQATPTFSVQKSDTAAGLHNEDDPFASCLAKMAAGHKPNGSMDQQIMLQQQQLWLQQQDRIIAKKMSYI